MEQYSYYGSGRYFVVTNKYPPTSAVYGLPVDSADYPGKLGKFAGMEFGDGHRERFDLETPENLAPDRELYNLRSDVDDGALLIREDMGRRKYDYALDENYNAWDQGRNDGIDVSSRREPKDIQHRFTEEPEHDEEYKQPVVDHTLIDTIATKEDYTEKDRNHKLPEPALYHDRSDVAMGNNRATKTEEERIIGSSRVKGKSEVGKTDEFEQKERHEATDLDGVNEEYQNNEEWREDRGEFNEHNSFPRSDKTRYGRTYQGKESERPYYVVNKNDNRPLKKDGPFAGDGRYEEEGKKEGIDQNVPYYQTHEPENPNRLEEESYIGRQEIPNEGRQFDQKERNGEKGPSLMDENRKIGGYDDMIKDRSFAPKVVAYEKYDDDRKTPIAESKFLKENKEARREKSSQQEFPEYMSYRYPEEQKERMNGVLTYEQTSKGNYPIYGQYEENPIQSIERMEDEISPKEHNFAMETQGYSKYNDEQQYDFEIDVDEVCENEKKAGMEIQNEDVVTEELINEEFHEIQSETLALEVLDDDEVYEENEESDWPPPPEDNGQEETESRPGYERRGEYFPEQRNNNIIEDSSLYTSFLTIDVTPGKRESLDGPVLADSKHRSSLLNLVTGSHELEHSEDNLELDKDDKDKIRHDIEMISKYLHNMPLGASYWPQNYDVLRDLVKLYLASKNTSSAALNYLLDYFLKLDWPGLFLKCSRKIMKSYPQVFVHSSDRKVWLYVCLCFSICGIDCQLQISCIVVKYEQDIPTPGQILCLPCCLMWPMLKTKLMENYIVFIYFAREKLII